VLFRSKSLVPLKQELNECKTTIRDLGAFYSNDIKSLHSMFSYATKDIISKSDASIQKEVKKVQFSMQEACRIQHTAAEELRTRELEKCRQVNQELDAKYQQTLNKLEEEIEAKFTQKLNHDTVINELKTEILSVKEVLSEKNAELSTLRSKKETDDSKLASRVKVLEQEVLEKSRSLDADRTRIHEMQKQFDGKLSLLMQGGDIALSNANTALAKKDLLILTLEKTIKASENELLMLKNDREKTVDAHQSRIKQLQDKFLIQIQEARTASSKQSMMETDLILAKKDTETTEKIAQITAGLEKSYNSQITTLTSKTTMLQLKLEQSQQDSKETNDRLSSLDECTQDLIKTLSAKISTLESQNNDLLESQKEAIEEAKCRQPKVSTLEDSEALSKKNAEIEFLKNTVRIECEERMMLLSKLTRLQGSERPCVDIAKAAEVKGKK